MRNKIEDREVKAVGMRDLSLVSRDMIRDRVIQALDWLEKRTRMIWTKLEEIEARMIGMRNDKPMGVEPMARTITYILKREGVQVQHILIPAHVLLLWACA